MRWLMLGISAVASIASAHFYVVQADQHAAASRAAAAAQQARVGLANARHNVSTLTKRQRSLSARGFGPAVQDAFLVDVPLCATSSAESL